MKISYAITVKDELSEIQRLVDLLLAEKRPQDEIVILFDQRNGSKRVEEFLRSHSINGEFLWVGKEFNNHFAEWKNLLNSLCSGDWIFQIDADEYPNKYLLSTLPEFLETNLEVDLFLVPRVNTVTGITQEHVDKWGWKVDNSGWVNFPDYQHRLYKNNNELTWVNQVHEIITNVKTYAFLPADEDFSLYHPKTIERQEQQNNYYSSL